MKIKNEYTKLKVGNQEIIKKNMIFDVYLKNIIDSQKKYKSNIDSIENKPISLMFTNVHVKLDTPIKGVTKDSILTNGSFDLLIYNPTIKVSSTNKSIKLIYKIDNTRMFMYKGLLYMGDECSILKGHKIMAISFGSYTTAYTYLDTSEYSIIIQEDGIIQISRSDLYSTDAIIDGFEYPHYLIQDTGKYYKGGNLMYSYLYSVGLGSQIGKMNAEYIIGKDIDMYQDDDFSFRFILKKSADSGVYPQKNRYSSNAKYPLTFNIKKELYPNANLFCKNNIYPCFSNYKYIIYRYKFYYYITNYENSNIEFYETDKEYTMSYYTEKKGILNIKTKIERNDENE